jgi:hypothetical protein
MKKSIIAVAVIALSFTACRFEEGPKLSLRSVKGRINGTWDLTKATLNGADASVDTYGTIEYTRDGSYTEKDTQGNVVDQGTYTIDGDQMTVTDGNGDASTTTITRLTSKEMWAKTTQDILGTTVESEFQFEKK